MYEFRLQNGDETIIVRNITKDSIISYIVKIADRVIVLERYESVIGFIEEIENRLKKKFILSIDN